jgi:hypothetical protein
LTERSKPRIFLCHASEDKPKVQELYHQLKAAGYRPWLDKYDLLPGQDWWTEIKKIMDDSYNLVVVCLSPNSTTKRGVVQKEIKRALDVLDEMPEDTIYLIPARLEPCQAPARLSSLHWVDLFEPDGFDNLKRALDFEIARRQPEAQPDPPAINEARPQPLTSLQQQRLADLQHNLEQDYQLLKEYEDLLRLADDPRRLLRYRREIERQKAAIAGYEQQLADIVPEAATRPEAMPTQIQQALAALQTQIVTLEQRLLAGQQSLSEQLRQQQSALLAHIDARHRETIGRVTARLEADQLETVDLLYDLVDRQQLAQWELNEITTLVQQSLVKLKDAPNAAYWQQLLVAAKGTKALDQKLMLPLIPCFLEYELELRADTLPALQKVWQRLRAKVKR